MFIEAIALIVKRSDAEGRTHWSQLCRDSDAA